LNDDLAAVDDVVLGDFDGDGRSDIAFQHLDIWRFARGGRGEALRLRDADVDGIQRIREGTVGRFLGGRRDVFLRFPTILRPRQSPYTRLAFYRFAYGSSSDRFVLHSRQKMR
jgi:hypothetical protein